MVEAAESETGADIPLPLYIVLAVLIHKWGQSISECLCGEKDRVIISLGHYACVKKVLEEVIYVSKWRAELDKSNWHYVQEGREGKDLCI